MSGSVLARQDRALTPDEQAALLRDRLGDDAVLRVTDAHGTVTVYVAPERWVDAVERCRDEDQLAYDMFDSLFGIDAREDGFEVVVVLYATTIGTRIALRTLCPGGREAPTLASVMVSSVRSGRISDTLLTNVVLPTPKLPATNSLTDRVTVSGT